MKKLVLLLFAGCMVVSSVIVLSSCAHKCSFSDTWIRDEHSHWHICEKEDCTEISDRADHTWNEGEITTKATQESDGVKTFTCTVCSQTKDEPVAFTGMTEDEWDAAFVDSVFENFTYCETAVVESNGIQVTTVSNYKFTENEAWVSLEIAGQTVEDSISGSQVQSAREAFLDTLLPFIQFDNYKYDPETKSYTLIGEVEITSIGVDATTVVLKFVDGKLAEIVYTCQYEQSESAFDVTSTVSITDYGTTEVTQTAA